MSAKFRARPDADEGPKGEWSDATDPAVSATHWPKGRTWFGLGLPYLERESLPEGAKSSHKSGMTMVQPSKWWNQARSRLLARFLSIPELHYLADAAANEDEAGLRAYCAIRVAAKQSAERHAAGKTSPEDLIRQPPPADPERVERSLHRLAPVVNHLRQILGSGGSREYRLRRVLTTDLLVWPLVPFLPVCLRPVGIEPESNYSERRDEADMIRRADAIAAEMVPA